MPERWERRLQTLKDVDAPPSISARVAEGPRSHAEPGPSPARRAVTIVVAFAVFAAAGVFAWQALRPVDTPTVIDGAEPGEVVVEFHVGDLNNTQPAATLSTAEGSVDGKVGSYCWTFDGGTGCGDVFDVSFKAGEYLEVVAGSTVSALGDADSVDGEIDRASNYPFDRVRPLGTLDQPLPLDLAPGRYVLALTAHADQGDVPFFFPIELVAPEPDVTASPVSSTLQVACGSAGAEIADPTVALQPDGAHVEVVDAGGFSELLLEPVDPYQVSFSSGSDGLDGPFVRELVPGRWKTACVSGTQVETPVEGWAEFTVVDPGRVWTSTTLACDHRNWVTSSPVGTIPKADGETPEQAIARALSLPSTDVIEPAGFPNSVSPTYRVVRDGETVAWLWFEDWRRGDWRTSAVFTCEGAGIGFVNGQS